MKNPIPYTGLFHTPTLEELDERIQGLPASDAALIYTYVMMTLNACHALVDEHYHETTSEDL